MAHANLTEQLKQIGIYEGAVLNCFYTTGEQHGSITITRVTEKSVFHAKHGLGNGEFRDSHLTVIKNVTKLNVWRPTFNKVIGGKPIVK